VEKNKDAVIDNLKNTITAVLSECPEPFVTSFTAYKKGKLENKPALIELSGIESFQQALQDRISSEVYLHVRRKHTKAICKMLMKEVENEITFRNNKRAEKTSENDISLSALQKDLILFNSVFVERIDNFNQL
jgi:hypothetical protein